MVIINFFEFLFKSFQKNLLVFINSLTVNELNNSITFLSYKIIIFLQKNVFIFFTYKKKKFWKDGNTLIKSPFVFKVSKLSYDLVIFIVTVCLWLPNTLSFFLNNLEFSKILNFFQYSLQKSNNFFSVLYLSEFFLIGKNKAFRDLNYE